MYKLLFLLLLSVGARSQTFYKTPSGQKYHLGSCHTVKNVSQEITSQQAIELGLQPCKVCRPANIYGTGMAVPNKAKGQGNTVQCKGTTKAGTRCRHKTRIGDGYCFQHKRGK
jgi:hypothetical protein